MVKLELEGTQPVNRPAQFGAKGCRVKKILAKSSWFKRKKQGQNKSDHNGQSKPQSSHSQDKGQPETIIFAISTEGSTWRKQMQKIDNQAQGKLAFGKVRVLKKLGTSLINLIENQDPWRSDHCGRSECWPCQSKPGSCKSHNILYLIQCMTCHKLGK